MRKAVLLNHGVTPNLTNEFLTGDHFALVGCQDRKGMDDLRAEREDLPVAPKDVLGWIEAERAKRQLLLGTAPRFRKVSVHGGNFHK
jgi:hypothetical protein